MLKQELKKTAEKVEKTKKRKKSIDKSWEEE